MIKNSYWPWAVQGGNFSPRTLLKCWNYLVDISLFHSIFCSKWAVSLTSQLSTWPELGQSVSAFGFSRTRWAVCDQSMWRNEAMVQPIYHELSWLNVELGPYPFVGWLRMKNIENDSKLFRYMNDVYQAFFPHNLRASLVITQLFTDNPLPPFPLQRSAMFIWNRFSKNPTSTILKNY